MMLYAYMIYVCIFINIIIYNYIYIYQQLQDSLIIRIMGIGISIINVGKKRKTLQHVSSVLKKSADYDE